MDFGQEGVFSMRSQKHFDFMAGLEINLITELGCDSYFDKQDGRT
jgi:hypothetical protein